MVNPEEKRWEQVEKLIGQKISKNINELHANSQTFGERVADRLADIAGSWGFIIGFICVLFGWIVLNTVLLLKRAYDPYPFILLNLILSCVAAVQAPVIMMSQNRQEDRDRLRAEHDYEINLKAEILIEEIFYRLDRLEKRQAVIEEINREIKELLAQRKL